MKHNQPLMISVIILIMAFPISGCHNTPQQEKTTVNLVKTDIVRKESNEIIISYPGKVVPSKDVNLSFRVAGPIAKVYVVKGEYVLEGDVIAEIDDRDYMLQLQATEAEYQQIKAEAGRVIELSKRNSATQNDYDKAFYGLQQISAKYSAHRNALADTKMKAPFNGYIQDIYFEANETVNAGMPVISMISSSAPEVEINIPSGDFVKRDRFSNYYCTIDIAEGSVFPLKYVDVTKKANLNQLYTARFILTPGKDFTPSPGMSATVYIKYSYPNNHLVSIPLSAIFEDDSRSFVWVVKKDNTITKRKVIPMEIKRDGTAIVSDGLEDGELVVSAGIHSLKEGDTVKLLPHKSSTNIGNIL